MILLVGSRGNIGGRYAAILRYLKIDFVGVDVGDKWPDPSTYDKAIVATPTSTHYKICLRLAKLKKTFLCEKPLSKNPEEIQHLIDIGADGYMVNNWCHVTEKIIKPNSAKVYYDCWNTGKDGLLWDCIQLVYIARGNNFKINNQHPIFWATIDLRAGSNRIGLEKIAHSYCYMIDCFIEEKTDKLWSLKDALAATKKVLKYEQG